ADSFLSRRSSSLSAGVLWMTTVYAPALAYWCVHVTVPEYSLLVLSPQSTITVLPSAMTRLCSVSVWFGAVVVAVSVSVTGPSSSPLTRDRRPGSAKALAIAGRLFQNGWPIAGRCFGKAIRPPGA